MSRKAIGERGTISVRSEDEPSSTCWTGRSVQSQGTAATPPMRRRIRIHGFLSRQKTRFKRPMWPQYALSSEVIVTVHPQSATYGAVCRWLKRDYVGGGTALSQGENERWST